MIVFVRSFVVFLLIFSGFLSMAQDGHYGSIRVKVLDAENNQPLPYVNVYLNRTTIGGYTNDQGEIEVKRIPFGTHELVFSSIGHKPLQRKLIVRAEQPVYMTVKLLVRVLETVEVSAKRDDKWNRQLSQFEKLFFGEHYKDCKIANPWILDFKTVKGNFIAAAPEPLKIENDYLGYNMSFEIKTCAFNNTSFVITGNVRFEEKAPDSTTLEQWSNRRESIYRGSPQHFLRSVLRDDLLKEGFDVFSDVTTSADLIRSAYFLGNIGKNIIATSFHGRVDEVSPGIYSLRFPSRLEVHYLRKKAPRSVYRNVGHAVSWMEVKDAKLMVSREGVVQNPENLILLGNMSNLRVADWLPLDYNYVNEQPVEPEIAPTVFTDVLLEKPYIQTDRNYYYNRETIWLKGYVNYFVPILKDTLSQSIYVDLVDHSGNTVLSKLYPIDSGMFQGDIAINTSLKPGLYQLKAYTQWMLNFDQRLIFTKTISLLGEKEAVRMVSAYDHADDTTQSVTIKSGKDVYRPRDLITLTIDVRDSLDFPAASDLSISVTDIEQAVPPSNEKTILESFAYYDRAEKDSLARIKYNIQYGIDFKGTFWLGRKRDQGIITVFDDKQKTSFAVISDTLGRFQQTLSFIDTARFYVDAVSPNKKKGRVVMDTVKHPPPPALTFDPLPLDIYTAENIRHDKGLSLNATRVLDEVTIKSTRIVKQETTPEVIHAQADYVVSGDWIQKNNIMDVTTALGRKVPGMSAGFAAGVVRLGPGISSFGDMTPLIVIDGVAQFNNGNLVDLLNDIPIRSIDRIDVLKFGGTASYGSRGANGVIAIYTKKGVNNAGGPKDLNRSKMQRVKLMGYSPVTAFVAPDYSKPGDNGYFDYRSTIFWKPDLVTDGASPATVSFYAADAMTRYRIVVEGVTSAGVPVRGEKIITITSDK